MTEEKKIEDEKKLNEEKLKKVTGGTPAGIALCEYCGHALNPINMKCMKCGRQA